MKPSNTGLHSQKVVSLPGIKEDSSSEERKLSLVCGNSSELPSLPNIALELLENVNELPYEALAHIIQLDPALSTRILQLANTPLFSKGKWIDNLETAIALLGTETIKNIALSFVMVKTFRRETRDEFDFENFWRRAICTAVSAKLLAEEIKIPAEKTYLSGLLIDIGILVMYLCRPEDYLRVFDKKRTRELSTIEAERKVFGVDHQEVGAELAELWSLPEDLALHIRYHHFPEKAPPEVRQEVEILFLAQRISGIYFTFRALDKYNFIMRRAEEILSLTPSRMENLVDKTATYTRKLLSIFNLPGQEIRPYSEILEEADREIQRLSINYAQLLQKLREEKTRAEALASKLEKANQRLQEMALRDPLTGLYNRRYFRERLAEELARCFRYRSPLTVILADLDHFKKINDTYGHLCGDEVLQAVAATIQKEIRKCDVAARYGGEEFVILLPHTDLQGGVAMAERLRQLISELEVRCGKDKVRTTVSLGVCSLTSFKEIDEKKFLAMADQLLYLSKKNGRNRVSAASI